MSKACPWYTELQHAAARMQAASYTSPSVLLVRLPFTRTHPPPARTHTAYMLSPAGWKGTFVCEADKGKALDMYVQACLHAVCVPDVHASTHT